MGLIRIANELNVVRNAEVAALDGLHCGKSQSVVHGENGIGGLRQVEQREGIDEPCIILHLMTGHKPWLHLHATFLDGLQVTVLAIGHHAHVIGPSEKRHAARSTGNHV